MHMAFLSRVFKNLQWYGMTPFTEKPPKQAVFLRFNLVFAFLKIAVQRWFKMQESDERMSDSGRRNRQIPNPSLMGIF